MNPKDPERTQQVSEAEQEKLVAYLDGELDDATEQQMLADLGRRPELRQEADSLRKTWELLDFLPRPSPAPQFTERTMQKLQLTKVLLVRREQWWRRLAVAGWIATLLLVGLLGFAIAYYWPDRQAAADAKVQPSATKPPVETPPEFISDEDRFLRMLRGDLARTLNNLNPHLQPYERQELMRKRRQGGLIFIEELLNLAAKYKVSLQPPSPLPSREEDTPAGRLKRPTKPAGTKTGTPPAGGE